MKRCPECGRNYNDDSMSFCLDDGSELLFGPASMDEPATAILHSTAAPGEAPTRAQIHMTDQTAVLPANTGDIVPTPRGLDKRLLAAPFLLAIIALGGFFGYRYFKPVSGGPINSIAVLPFQNKSGDPNSEYLSDGLAESLIYRLSQIPDLKVSPTSSVIQYKGKDTKVATIASELGVDAVMTGRLAQIGDNLTISIELVDVRNNTLLWGEQYERKMADLLATQREIATTITQKLQLKLASSETKGITKKYTDNNDAYRLYMKGRFYWNKRTAEGLRQSVVYFKQAIEKDPSFALAHSGMAEAYVIFPNYSVASPKDSMPQSKDAALKALEIDDSLAEPHAALGLYYNNYAWNMPLAEKELRRAIEPNPNYATAFHWLGNILAAMQRGDEAIAAARRAEELDPLSLIISADTMWDFVTLRRYDEAIAQSERTLLLDPNFYYAHYILGQAYYGKGMYKQAIQAIRKSIELNEDPFAKALLVQALAKAGNRAEAVKLRDDLKSESTRRFVPNYFLAMASIAVGEKDEAIALLEKDIADRGNWVSAIAVLPALDDLRSDPRFATLVKNVESSKLD